MADNQQDATTNNDNKDNVNNINNNYNHRRSNNDEDSNNHFKASIRFTKSGKMHAVRISFPLRAVGGGGGGGNGASPPPHVTTPYSSYPALCWQGSTYTGASPSDDN